MWRGRPELSKSFLKELLKEGIQLLNDVGISPSLEAYKYKPDPQRLVPSESLSVAETIVSQYAFSSFSIVERSLNF